jgi:hypothetical protein
VPDLRLDCLVRTGIRIPSSLMEPEDTDGTAVIGGVKDMELACGGSTSSCWEPKVSVSCVNSDNAAICALFLVAKPPERKGSGPNAAWRGACTGRMRRRVAVVVGSKKDKKGSCVQVG